nr:hypothetical protein [Candidatus Prometheoarchaeum syntrophicum]QEE17804.1 hypothetical protein DSAG12_03642 [Candidatus Prometheoarchaeum syntrophicum]
MNENANKLFCTECGSTISQEQIDLLIQGKKIYCETCGKMIKTKTVKIEGKSDSAKKNWKEIGKSLGHSLKKGGEIIKENVEIQYNEVKKKLKNESSLEKPSNPPPYEEEKSETHDIPYQNIYRDKVPKKSNFQRGFQPSTGKYSYFHRMNMTTAILELIWVLVIGVVILMKMIPLIGTPGFSTELLKSLVPLVASLIILFYDYFYVRMRIERHDLTNYGLEYLVVGILGSFFAFGAGIFLCFKAFLVLIIAIADRAIFFSNKYKKSFGEVLLSILNKFSSIFGFIILGPSIFLINEMDSITKTYFFIAIAALLIDLIVVQLFSYKKQIKDIVLWIGIVKLILGIIASFYNLAGLMLAIGGGIMVLTSVLSEKY